ncbi:ABC transporter permease [Luteibaculum oceani]|nr:ABC transporter permease [Luteibaculum oceani]
MLISRFIAKLKKDPAGIFGASILLIAIIVSVLGANIRPDATTHSNNQHPEIAKIPPGSKVDFLSFEKGEKASFFQRLFFGGDIGVSEIPVDTFWVQKGTVFYRRCTTNGPLIKVEEREIEQPVELVQRTFWLGTDKLGRDVLSRLMSGTLVSLSVGLISVVISLLIGVFLGGLAGYFGGWLDAAIMWVVNVVWSIPTLLMVMAITLALGKGFVQVFIAVGLTMWVEVARVTRGRFMEIKQLDYVMAARLFNTPPLKIIFREMLPNAVGPLIVIAAGNFSTAILLEAGLSFLGIGAQVPMASWGGMIKDHFSYLTTDAAFIPIVPGVAIMLLVLSFIWVGNTLRDTTDVKA